MYGKIIFALLSIQILVALVSAQIDLVNSEHEVAGKA